MKQFFKRSIRQATLPAFTKKVFLKLVILGVALTVAALLQNQVNAPVGTFAAQAAVNTISTVIPDGLTSGRVEIDKMIAEAGARYGVDPRLIYFVMRQESRFHPQACSPRNAQGLMQLIPATAERFHVGNIRDPEQNIDGGVRYLRWLLERFQGDVRLALAGYNAGEGAVDKSGHQVPSFRETQDYVRNITAAYGQTFHPILEPEQAREKFCVTPLSPESQDAIQ